MGGGQGERHSGKRQRGRHTTEVTVASATTTAQVINVQSVIQREWNILFGLLLIKNSC